MFDHLLFLELFFESVAASGTPVRDLYEMVQHAGNVLTRLYLMVTVASVFIKSRELPVKDILVDLLEMAKGVQHPTRGLFLRYYMLQKCEDKLPEEGSEYAGEGGGPEDALKFVMTIFVEMNKLWVRMQHSKEHRSTKRREKERREIRAVVATAVGRIGSLQGLSLHTFATNVLPELLLQVQACGDRLAQEFLLDSITQCFPPTFSVCTLIPYLRTVLACEASVDCHKVISGHISRITDAISRESDAPALGAREAADMQAATEAAAGLGFYDQLALGEDTFNPEAPVPEGAKLPSEGTAAAAPPAPGSGEEGEVAPPAAPPAADDAAPKPAHTDRGEGGIDGKGVRYSNTAPSSAPAVIPAAIPVFNTFFAYLQRLVGDRADSESPLEPLTIVQLFEALLGLATAAYKGNAGHIDAVLAGTGAALAASEATIDANASFAVEGLYGSIHAALPLREALALPSYGTLMRPLAYTHRRAIANKLLLTALGEDPTTPSGAQAAPPVQLASEEAVEQLLSALAPIVRAPEGIPSTAGDAEGAGTAALSEDFVAEQTNMARLVHCMPVKSMEPAATFAALSCMRKHFGYGGAARVQFTLPPVVMAALALCKRLKPTVVAARAEAGEGELSAEGAAALASLKGAFKFVHQTCHALGSTRQPVKALYLSMQAAVVASSTGFAYDFASQSFVLYEDIAESRVQVQCLRTIVGALHACKEAGMAQESYESLITRATQSSTKLLRKPDQVLAVLRAAHLFWVPGSKATGVEAYQAPAGVLQCLKRALKIADEYMPASNDLFVRIFDAYVYFFERRVPTVTATHINHNIALVQENLAAMPSGAEKDAVATHFRNILAHIAQVKATPSGATLYAEVSAV